MDAQSRGRAGDIDPADQWVFDPETGDYKLRPPAPAARPSPSPRPSSQADNPAPRAGRRQAPPHGEVPRQRRRRPEGGSTPEDGARNGAADGEKPAGRAAARKAAGGRAAARQAAGGRAASRRKARPKKSVKKKVLLWTGGVTAFMVTGTAVAAYLAYEHFNGNIDTVDVGDAAEGGFGSDGPLNILLIGTDKRTGEGNEGYGDKNSPGHADTTFLLHVSADRTNATVMSIPRDLKTDIPDCPTKREDGTTKVIPGEQDVRFNTSLGQAGRDPGCTMRTVKEMTGLDVHHFMMADFNAVKTLTTAVGGVPVCLEKPVDDPKSHLELPAGESVVEGEQALAFVRTRGSFGNKGDLDRIKVQQQFLSSMIRQFKSNDTLTDPGKLWDLAEAATKALTVDTGIGTIKKLSDLGRELSGIKTKNISFLTVPVADNPAEKVKATVVLQQPKASQVFAMLREDVSFTEVEKKEKAAKDKAKKEQEALLKGERAAASDVRVEILNGGEIAGAAQTTLTWLQNTQSVLKSSNGGNAPEQLDRTTLEYGPNQADQARKLADIMGLPASALKPGSVDAGPMEPMVLTLGADFKEAGLPIAAPAKAPEDLGKVEADKKICAK
ncbi:LCP family protein [Streptomyces pini]|uniref:Transcriptional attenuator, LytR family n=1 Tax=Streptomyces pini TaxID=1520580 RepID=A0A1I3TQQ5_9ACTN|nr:LCP family protein [Streptomyces pini]SFJ72813.1 transcriptional attenuator, LytR family [Streptomyces pini]